MSTETTLEGGTIPLLGRLSDTANRWSEWALFVLMMLMVIVTTAQVIFRFFFTALTWSEELCCFLLVLSSLVGAAVAFKRGNHIAITFLSEKLPPGARKSLTTAVHLLGLLFFGIVTVYGAILMKNEAGQLTPALQISMMWVYLMYPVVGLVVVIHLLDGISRTWKGAAT